MKDRRISVRIPVATVAHITPHGLESSTKVIVRDLSTSGMGCISDNPYQKGDVLWVKIKLMMQNKQALVETLTGRIAWVSEINDQKYALGVEFRDVELKNPKLYAYIMELESMADPI